MENAPTKWQDLIESYGLTQTVKQQTRVCEHTRTLIDHFYTSHPHHVCQTDVIQIALSDHYPTCCVRLHNSYRKQAHTTIKYRSYKHFNEQAFQEDLAKVPFSTLDTITDPNEALETWQCMFLEVVNKHAPLKEKRVKHPKQPEWIDDDILEAMATRDKFAHKNDSKNRNIWRNKVNNMIRQAKANYYQNMIHQNANNSKAIWKYLRKLAPKSKSTTPQTMIHNGKNLNEPADIANALNDHFSNVASKYITNPSSATETFNTSSLKNFVRTKIDSTVQFNIPPIDESFVHKELLSLDTKKAVGIDGIAAKLLKAAASIISKPLTKYLT